MRTKQILVLVLLAMVFAGCAGTSTPGKKREITMYQTRVGNATALDIKTKVQRILLKFQYQVVRFEESYDQIFFETQWKYRIPFEDEYELNIVDCRTRIIVRSTPRTRTYTGDSYDLHTVRFEAENQVRFAGSQEWVEMPLTDMFMDYIKKVVEDLKMELETGIGRY